MDLLYNYPEMLDVATIAKFLQVTPKTVRKHIDNDDIPAIKVGKLYRIPKEWVLNLLTPNIPGVSSTTVDSDHERRLSDETK